MFNLLPGLPLDGGRVVSAAVWRATGRRHTGTVVAAGWAGASPCVVLVGVPFLVAPLLGRDPTLVDVIWGGLLGAFIWVGCQPGHRPGRRAAAAARRCRPGP